jgi:hypothetical protein
VAVAATGDIWNVEFWTRGAGQYALNVKAFQVSSTVGGVGVSDIAIADAFSQTYLPLYRACMSNMAESYGVQVYRTYPSPSTGVYVVNIGSGSIVSGLAPPQLAGLIRFRNAGLGRRNKSRLYVPFVPQAVITASGSPSALYVSRCRTLGAEMVVGVQATEMADAANFVLVTRSDPPEDARLLTSRDVANQFATMRSRSRLYGDDMPPF